MRAGKLRHKAELQENVPTRNAVGEEVPSWSTIYWFWCSIEPLSGRELMSAQQVNSELSHRIRMRYKAGVTPKMRVLLGARAFNINAVLNVQERDRELELLCTEGT